MSLQAKALSRCGNFRRGCPIMLSRNPKKSNGFCITQGNANLESANEHQWRSAEPSFHDVVRRLRDGDALRHRLDIEI